MRKRAGGFLVIILVLIFHPVLSSAGNISVSFSPERGFYNSRFKLALSATDPASVIMYTTDCSIPTMKNGNVYVSELVITRTMVVKAKAYSANDSSSLETHTFLFPEALRNQGKNPSGFPATWGGSSTIAADYEMDPLIVDHPAYSDLISKALKSLPVLSLSMPVDEWFNPKTGLYVGYPNSDVTREKPVSAEWIYADSTKNFGLNCGVQNQGGTSIIDWKVPKQSMRLLFKEKYGSKKLNKKLFPDSKIDEINTLVVDGFLYAWLHPWDAKQCETTLFFRDQLCSDLQNAMGGLSFHGLYVHLFINGLYWGLYDLHERPDEDFMTEYYDAEDTDFDIIKHNQKEVVAGTNASYLKLLSEARAGFPSPESLENIRQYLDLDAFIDYMILNFYLGNYDWAHQNYYAAFNKVKPSGYRFYTWDAEHVMRYSDVNYDATKKADVGGPTEIHSLLKKIAEYRVMFADAFYKHAFNKGALSIENFEKKFISRKNEIDLATILESARWGDYRKAAYGTTYTRNDHWIPEVNRALTNYIPNRREIVVGQLRNSENLLYPATLPPLSNLESGVVKTGQKVELTNPNQGAGYIFYTTDGSDPRKTGGGLGGSVWQSALEVNGAVLIKARCINPTNNEWSPLAEMYFVPENGHDGLMMSEIMYHEGTRELEFIELMNASQQNMDLIGISFTDGIEYTFNKNLILKPGGFVVLANDRALFEAAYHFEPYGIFSKRLNNKAETIVLSNLAGQVIDSLTYSDSAPWPEGADGNQRSLELIHPDLDNALPSSWRASEKLYGSPEKYVLNAKEKETRISNGVHVYPNPVTNQVNIATDDHDYTGHEVLLTVHNQTGQLVKSALVSFSNSTLQMDLNGLDAGVYLLRISRPGNASLSEAVRIIKLR